MNTMLNITHTQLPSGTHFHKDKQKCLVLPQVGKVRMDVDGPLAEKKEEEKRKLKRFALVVYFLLSGSESGNLKPEDLQPVLPSVSLASWSVSAGMFAPPSPDLQSLPCYLYLMNLAEGLDMSWITFTDIHSYALLRFTGAWTDKMKTWHLWNMIRSTASLKLKKKKSMIPCDALKV